MCFRALEGKKKNYLFLVGEVKFMLTIPESDFLSAPVVVGGGLAWWAGEMGVGAEPES